MSPLKKSDVKNHLSTRSGISAFSFGQTTPKVPADSETKAPGTKPDDTDTTISPGHPFSPEAVTTALAGGSVGIPD